MKSISEIKEKIKRRATAFTTGGFRPLNTLEESWIGRVFAYKENEQIPLDIEGKEMIPLAQFYLPNLPYIPKQLEGIKLLTVFVSAQFGEPLEPMGNHWVIREYTSLDEVLYKDLINKKSFLKAFALKSEFLEEDYPLWDGGGLSHSEEEAILTLERNGIIENYYKEVKHSYLTKIGGYPSYCQSGIGVDDEYGEGFEYLFQISSDSKANLNVVDNGSLMFARNPKTKQWSLYYDFY